MLPWIIPQYIVSLSIMFISISVSTCVLLFVEFSLPGSLNSMGVDALNASVHSTTTGLYLILHDTKHAFIHMCSILIDALICRKV